MDIKIEKKASLPIKLITVVLSVIAIFTVTIFLKQYIQSASNLIKKDDVVTAKVQRGEFLVDVRGLGSLSIEKRHLITSQTGGKVMDVLVKPGQMVVKGQLIARLENIELNENLTQKKNQLLKLKAQHQVIISEQKARVEEAETSFFEAELAYKSDKMQWEAQSTLLAQGNSTISKLDHYRSEFSMKKSSNKVALQKSKISTQKAILVAKQNSQKAELASLVSEINMLKNNIENLNVYSPITGQIQDVFIELGMRLTNASSVAEIADHKKLIAKINVPELDAPNIQIDQSAVIDTYTTQLNAKVSRVSPKVSNGHVEVELIILDTLPNEARDKLNIEGVINTHLKQDTLFVEIPRNAIANNENKIFVIDQHIATKKLVQFGKRSVNHIEIIEGLHLDERIIISDMGKYSNDNQVLLH